MLCLKQYLEINSLGILSECTLPPYTSHIETNCKTISSKVMLLLTWNSKATTIQSLLGMKWCIYVAPKIFYFQNWIKFSEGLIFFFYRSMKKRRKCGNVNCAKSKVSMTIDFEPVSKKAQKWSKPSLIKHTR